MVCRATLWVFILDGILGADGALPLFLAKMKESSFTDI